jgi:tripartite-type tricarboxylate transporter receptor subunit TctC
MKNAKYAALALPFAIARATCADAADPAAAYPAKPIRFIVGFTPGGTSDVVARLLAQKLAETWTQPLVVDNRPGAGGNLAVEIVARSAPDGYTLLCASSSFSIIPSLIRNLSYSPTRDFAPVTLMSSAPYLLVLHPAVPAQSVKELIALAKAQPGKLNYASAGAGSTLHLAGELFKSLAGVDIVHVPYKGATGVTDLIAGAVQLSFAGLPQTLPHVKAGRLKALAVTTARRAAALPDLPTIAEAGVPGYEVDPWYGVIAPAGTPRAIIEQLNTAFARALAAPDVKEKFMLQGLEPRATTPAEFAALIEKEIAKWAKVVRDAGIKAE